jgi:protein-export membrane protein SecD
MSSSSKHRLQLGLVLVIAIFGFLFALPKGPNWIRKELKLHLGLDLAGGAHLVYQADVESIPSGDREGAVESARDVIERRVNALGVGEPVVQTNKAEDGYRILVELPGITDVNEAIKRIGDTPVLEFKEQADPIPLTDSERAERESYNQVQKKRAESLLEQIKNASDEEFAKKAQEISEDPNTKEKGGDFGFINQEEYPADELTGTLFEKITDGETYDGIAETAYGFHIVRRVATQCRNTEKNEVVPCPPKDQKDAWKNLLEEVRGRHIMFLKRSLDPQYAVDPWKNTPLSGKHLKRASVEFDQNTATPIVSLNFNDEGAKLFEEITGRNVDKLVAIFLDGEMLSSPRVQQKISGGSAVITGTFTLEQTRELVKRLNAGALPVNITLIAQQQIGSSLGNQAVEKSFMAGVLGLLVVVLFMIIYYRLPGLIASISLIIYSLIMISLFKLVPVTLTLSGIAGFILTLGMAVDANVLIFERIKEELASKKTQRAAIDEGFARAWSSIRDGNISTLISGLILIFLGEGLIKGFGIALCMGIIISMFTAISVTRILLKLVAKQGEEGGRLWGVSK